MLKAVAAGLTTAASSRTRENVSRINSGINHLALANAKLLLAQNSARLASDAAIGDAEREHHAHIARIAAR